MENTLNKLYEAQQRGRKDRNCLIAIAVLIVLAQGAAQWLS